MADLDSSAEIDIVHGPEAIVARIPLSEAVGPWMGEYRKLARSKGLGADVQEEPGKDVLVVTVPVGSSEQEVFAILDTARQLVDEAKVAAETRSDTESVTEQHVRTWWSRQDGESSP